MGSPGPRAFRGRDCDVEGILMSLFAAAVPVCFFDAGNDDMRFSC